MPELPEVEFARKLIDDRLVGHRIAHVWVADDPIVLEGVPPAVFASALTGATVEAASRRGKHLWLELDHRPWPTFHFGMTGAFRVAGVPPLQLESSAKAQPLDWPPKFTKLRLRMDDGTEVAMTNARRLGRIRLRQDPRSEPPIANLGLDPLVDRCSAAAVGKRLAKRSVAVKVVLLDQSAFAGVGNWIADEVLYQAKIDPRRPACDLDAGEVKRLAAKIRAVIRTAVSVDARKDRFPKAWLFHQRWGKNTDARTRRGAPIEFITVAGRTTAWVPSEQS